MKCWIFIPCATLNQNESKVVLINHACPTASSNLFTLVGGSIFQMITGADWAFEALLNTTMTITTLQQSTEAYLIQGMYLTCT